MTSRDRRGRSSPLDLDRLIARAPGAAQAAEDAEIAALVGELVRRLRSRKAITQSELARRTGMTQAHISELERGLGPNGPTVVTLSRIVRQLDDTILFDTASERSARDGEQLEEAMSWIADLVERQEQKPLHKDGSIYRSMTDAILAGIAASEDDTPNPFRMAVAKSVVSGIRLAEHFARRRAGPADQAKSLRAEEI